MKPLTIPADDRHQSMKTQIKKLSLTPSDIVLVMLPKGATRSNVQSMAEQIRKSILPGQRCIVTVDPVKIDTIANFLTPEDVHHLNVAIEKRLLLQPVGPLQMASLAGAKKILNRRKKHARH
jgi:hypothetical protein